ncbi:MAG TPA: VWA domain-containing protein [Candidatus Nitrosopolaris sp.]|nr:VWA domain-containing protein [Candidatus Nitrosopolaris sp.]
MPTPSVPLGLNYTHLRNDVLLDIATFLSRRWSNNNKTVIILTQDKMPSAKIGKTQITLPFLNYYLGTSFQQYRQWRVGLWHESMRIHYSTKIMSYDHAFGFLLNTIETKRVEILGLQDWEGMIKEIVFNEGMSWVSRPLLNSIYGKSKIIEAFSQYFLTGYLKGELYGNDLEKVKKASSFANEIVHDAIENHYHTEWIERHIPLLIKMLELDALTSVAILAPRTRINGLGMNQSDLVKQIEKIVRRSIKATDIDKTSREIIEGSDILSEFQTLLKESKKTENKGYESLDNLGLSIPEMMDVDPSPVYDADLIRKVKAKFRDWRTGWIERHELEGEEFDPESYVEMLPKNFLTDLKLSIKTKVAILLDHSSSIEHVELEYKRATVALCEALSYLGIKFAVYAFSTESGQVRCWIIKPPNLKWSATGSRRLTQIRASGGTPLAEIYGLLQPIAKSFKPDIMVTLTDGEPSDFDAVREMVLSYRKMGIHMVALGLGKNLNDSISIGHNLKYLTYERSLAVSRLEDIPKKVIYLLRD